MGEVLRRIVGKMLISVIKDDIIDAVGPLQTCSGLRGGIEAAIHAMRKSYSYEETEAIMLVDAENAFNKLTEKLPCRILNNFVQPSISIYITHTNNQPNLLSLEMKHMKLFIQRRDVLKVM